MENTLFIVENEEFVSHAIRLEVNFLFQLKNLNEQGFVRPVFI
jgi:hypothetical protein